MNTSSLPSEETVRGGMSLRTAEENSYYPQITQMFADLYFRGQLIYFRFCHTRGTSRFVLGLWYEGKTKSDAANPKQIQRAKTRMIETLSPIGRPVK